MRVRRNNGDWQRDSVIDLSALLRGGQSNRCLHFADLETSVFREPEYHHQYNQARQRTNQNPRRNAKPARRPGKISRPFGSMIKNGADKQKRRKNN
jgi:hypothetical protein